MAQGNISCCDIVPIGMVMLLLAGCGAIQQAAPPPYPVVHARTLLLDAHGFPPTWQPDPCEPACDRAERPTHATRTFGRRRIAGHVIQDVDVFPSVADAHTYYQRAYAFDFSPLQPPEKTFEPPSDMSYTSTLADEYMLGCGMQAVPACRALLRYRNYIIEFYFDIDAGFDDGLQHHEILPILQAMDQRVAQVLVSSVSTPTP